MLCGIGPVEAAVATARALAEERPSAVLHVGIAGARGLEPLTLVLGSEAVYCDAAGPLVPALALPGRRPARATARGASRTPCCARSGRARASAASHEIDVEAMEGFAVLRACELAGVPAVEVRVVSNEIDEPDRALWRFDDAFALLAETLPRLVAVASGRDETRKKPLPPPLPPETRTVGQLVAETLKLYGDHLWTSLALGVSVTVINQVTAGHEHAVFQVLVARGGRRR